jgi:predicted transcriptional regulator
MTKAKKALRVLIDGGRMTAEEVMTVAGLPYKSKGNILQYLRAQGYIESTTVMYQITDAGRAHAAKQPKTQYLEKKLETRRKRLAEQARAERGIPNSVWALGAMNA